MQLNNEVFSSVSLSLQKKIAKLAGIYENFNNPDKNIQFEIISSDIKKRKLKKLEIEDINRHKQFNDFNFWNQTENLESTDKIFKLNQLYEYWQKYSKFSYLDSESICYVTNILEQLSETIESVSIPFSGKESLLEKIKEEKSLIARAMYGRLSLVHGSSKHEDIQFYMQGSLQEIKVPSNELSLPQPRYGGIGDSLFVFVDYIEKYGDAEVKNRLKDFNCAHSYNKEKPPIQVPIDIKKHIPSKLKSPSFLFRGNNQRIEFFLDHRVFFEELTNIKGRINEENSFGDTVFSYETSLTRFENYKKDLSEFKKKLADRITLVDSSIKTGLMANFRQESNEFYKKMKSKLEEDHQDLEKEIKNIEGKIKGVKNALIIKDAKEKEIKDIKDNKTKAYAFYKQLHTRLNEFYLGLRGGASGFISIERKSDIEEKTGWFGRAVSFLNSTHILPFLRFISGNIIITDFATNLLSMFGNVRQFNTTQSISKAFGLDVDAQKLIFDFSIQITQIFVDSFENLQDEDLVNQSKLSAKISWWQSFVGFFKRTKESALAELQLTQAEMVAEFVVFTSVCALFNKTIDLEKPLLPQFISLFTIPEENENGIMSRISAVFSSDLKMKDRKHISLCDFFHNVGVKMLREDAKTWRYFQYAERKNIKNKEEEYGFRLATTEEKLKLQTVEGAKELGLKEKIPTTSSRMIEAVSAVSLGTFISSTFFSTKQSEVAGTAAMQAQGTIGKTMNGSIIEAKESIASAQSDKQLLNSGLQKTKLSNPQNLQQLKKSVLERYQRLQKEHEKNTSLVDQISKYISAIEKLSVDEADQSVDKFKNDLKRIVNNVSYAEAWWSATPVANLKSELIPLIDNFSLNNQNVVTCS